jgi:opacity protein-like surface antigen
MKTKNLLGLLGVLLLAASLLAMPGAARAEMYVEGYIGGTGAASFDTSFDLAVTPGVYHDMGTVPGRPSAAVIGGLKLGTWFVPTGFLGYSYPDWMKYFGFYTDFSFHRLDARKKAWADTYSGPDISTYTGISDFKSEGTVATWAFMFVARYGFFPDSEVPFGRLQPYVAVGPAVMFSTQELTIARYTEWSPGSASSVDIALALDAGLRYMCLKNVSVDLSFKYRYAHPSYRYHENFANGYEGSTTYSPTYNLFSFQLGAAYHF